MKINLVGSVNTINELMSGITLLLDELTIQLHPEGYPIHVKKEIGPLQIRNTNNKGEIIFEEIIQFYRALGIWVKNYQERQTFDITERRQFKTSGVMADVSRNAVLTINETQFFLRKMALMGLNMFFIYVEDIYEVPEYPYFGYMRGRYSEEELQLLDNYAAALGIELIPSVQTLAHLSTTLEWNYARDMKDTEDILLVGNPDTYIFLEKLLNAVKRPFRSNRIHIGMDEAMKLGLGKYLELNGYKSRFKIMSEHLEKVVALTERMNLEPMIWSDMFFRIGSKHNEYYDTDVNIPEEIMNTIPQDLQLVYWDYYHSDEKSYELFIKKHKDLGFLPIFAGGAWTWNGIAPNYGRAIINSEAALKACKKENVEEVYVTLWGDNGGETPLITALPIMQLYAEYTYCEEVNQDHLAERFEFCTGSKWNDFLTLNQFDETPGVQQHNLKSSNPSKFLLWQDVFIGLFDENIKGLPLNQHYEKLISKLIKAKESNSEFYSLFEFYEQLARVLSQKAEMGIRIKCVYDENNKDKMNQLVKEVQILQDEVRKLRVNHQRIWFKMYKPFGWEVLDIRYGGIISRLDTVQMRLQEWISGEISQIEELEEKRLPYDSKYDIVEGFLGTEKYHRIVTPGNLSQ